ncbi:unnamed protein product [Scytosiphon promiscuus]
MHLNNFTGAGSDDFGNLDKARNSCIKILALSPHPDTLDAHFMAGAIAVSASYTKIAQLKSPATGKKYVFQADFLNIMHSFKPIWRHPSAIRDSTWTMVVTYLLDIASAICILPPEGVLLPELDPLLVESFGVVCSTQPSLLDRFPEVGGAALRVLLQKKPLDELCRMSTALKVDTSLCDNKADVIQALFDGRKPMDAVLNQAPPKTSRAGPSRNEGELDEPKEDENNDAGEQDELQTSIGSSDGREGPSVSGPGAGSSGKLTGVDTREEEGEAMWTTQTHKEGAEPNLTPPFKGNLWGHSPVLPNTGHTNNESDDYTIASFKNGREAF